MALIIAITYSLSGDSPDSNRDITTTTEGRQIVVPTDATIINDTFAVLNATEIFTLMLGMSWPIDGNHFFVIYAT